jgi:hypothetical protein
MKNRLLAGTALAILTVTFGGCQKKVTAARPTTPVAASVPSVVSKN